LLGVGKRKRSNAPSREGWQHIDSKKTDPIAARTKAGNDEPVSGSGNPMTR